VVLGKRHVSVLVSKAPGFSLSSGFGVVFKRKTGLSCERPVLVGEAGYCQGVAENVPGWVHAEAWPVGLVQVPLQMAAPVESRLAVNPDGH
jgi:hypothetical protein